MNQPLYIAEEHLRGTRPDGTTVKIAMRLGAPYQTADGDWACHCALDGLYSHLADAVGVSSFQALTLAIGLLRSLIAHFIETGGRIEFADGAHTISVEVLFPVFPQ